MARQTSIDAYNTIKENGLLSYLRFQVYEALYMSGPMTAQETWHYLRNVSAMNGDARINGITPRFSELERLGVIKENLIRPCNISGRNVTEWIVTNSLPSKLEKKKSKDQIIKELQEEIKQLKAELTDLKEW